MYFINNSVYFNISYLQFLLSNIFNMCLHISSHWRSQVSGVGWACIEKKLEVKGGGKEGTGGGK